MIAGLCTDLLVFTFRVRKTSETSARRTLNEGCAISHHLKWGPSPANDVGGIAQHIREVEGTKEGKDGRLFLSLGVDGAKGCSQNNLS